MHDKVYLVNQLAMHKDKDSFTSILQVWYALRFSLSELQKLMFNSYILRLITTTKEHTSVIEVSYLLTANGKTTLTSDLNKNMCGQPGSCKLPGST